MTPLMTIGIMCDPFGLKVVILTQLEGLLVRPNCSSKIRAHWQATSSFKWAQLVSAQLKLKARKPYSPSLISLYLFEKDLTYFCRGVTGYPLLSLPSLPPLKAEFLLL
ncbi:hypothetical protein VNO77_02428 [Canavalia gladiata]|uniref:Uncharacterized protein n=1 Tax=Canavalia gladiata TaxID=3824 RepID=A0AAN9MT23_CANGL